MEQLVDELSVGTVFTVFAGEFRVDRWMETSITRPIAIVKKKSVSGWMSTQYRLEPSHPADPDGTELVIRTRKSSHWDVFAAFDPQDIEINEKQVIQTTTENADQNGEQA